MNMNTSLIQMAIGDCCRPSCKYREQAMHAQTNGKPMPTVPNAFVKIQHVKQGGLCTSSQMHLACYEKIEKALLRDISRKVSTMSESELIKAMWDRTRSGKFDMIRRSTFCECKCGGSFYVCTGDNRQPLTHGTDTCSPCTPSTEKKKKTKVHPTPVKAVSYQIYDEGADEEEIDDDLRQYIWTPGVECVHDSEEAQTLPPTECPLSFPTLPNNLPLLPSPSRINRKSELKPVVDIKSQAEFVMVTINGLSYEQLKRLRGMLIGRAGKNIKTIEDPHETKISLDLFPKHLRIWIRCSTRDNREICAIIIEHRSLEHVKTFN